MKRIFTLVAFLSAMTMAVQAQRVRIGVKGGLNIAKMSVSKDVVDSDNKVGFFLGPVLKLSLPAGFGADIAILYDQRNTDVSIGKSDSYLVPANTASISTGDETIKQKSFMVPVNVRYNIGLGSTAGLYLALGPQFGFPIGDKWYKTEVGDYRLRDANLSVNFGLGVYLLDCLEVGATYNLAAGKSGEFKNLNDIDTHNNAWQLNAAFFF